MIILGLLTAIGPLSIDTYLPGFATIARDLQIYCTALASGHWYLFCHRPIGGYGARLFFTEDTPKIFSKLMPVMGLSPVLTPAISGFIIQAYSLHIVFLILMCMGIMILIASWDGL